MAQASKGLIGALQASLGGLLSTSGRLHGGLGPSAGPAALVSGAWGLSACAAFTRSVATTSAGASATAPAEPGPASTASDAGSGAAQEAEAISSGSNSGGGGFSTGFRKVVSERRAGQLGALEGIVHIQNTLNNIILTLTDKQGLIKTYTSAGVVGYKGSRKSQPVAAEKAAEELARRALKLGYSSVQVRLKGAGSNKQYAVTSLAAAGLTITSLADVTPVPYNGCRLPKKRRV
ncbi:hypothetical protein CHLRE_06g288400v5 [Chlamydomonas reinhardtii]|uniref:Mitochondrial ribosomal protein S11 n=1 Tax=Chlamydomonas reinhardtii TaxID=3055 RepID=A0A2K3DQ48_CHLRE|nr:uncharacterized protein CHLRE_06g288400v5 [Chlamydomonas reinhardtii]PNW82661.1 hypothetical protein CHLRE_06g288400v5 [Chlamydomonas reinhardtii]7PKQ_k Chain k, uS11m [Chlamydomonas reinhardtii]